MVKLIKLFHIIINKKDDISWGYTKIEKIEMISESQIEV